MKKIILKTSTLVFVLFCIGCIAQNKVKEKYILKSNNIEQLEQFLAKTHPQDPRNPFLKKRIIELKNLDWVKGRDHAKPMSARPISEEVEKSLIIDSTSIIENEFITILEENKLTHKEKTVSLLNTLFNNQTTNPDVAILIKNNSNCNIIVRINGEQNLNIAIPKQQNSALVLKKGQYSFSTKICNSNYTSNKNVSKSMQITLNESKFNK